MMLCFLLSAIMHTSVIYNLRAGANMAFLCGFFAEMLKVCVS